MIDVTCAVIRNDENEVLIVQRGEKTDHPLRWEFPGGKIDEGETEEECIAREIREELSMDIVICGRLPEVIHDYGHKRIRLIPFVCDTLDEIPFLSEHIAYRWVNPSVFREINFSAADVFVAESYVGAYSATSDGQTPAEQEKPCNEYAGSDLQNIVDSIMSMKEAEWIAMSASENAAVLKKLMEYSYSSDRRLAFRASWIISKTYDKYPEIIEPYLAQLTDTLPEVESESTLRSFLRILSLCDMNRLDSHHHGLLADFCFSSLSSGFSAVAVKAYSMEILYNLSVIYPELGTELSASVRNVMEEGSAGIKARGRMILKKLEG